jgi:SNF family Na+-dependent transporter
MESVKALCFEQEQPSGERERWTNSFTFVLAAIGSAIGLGNFWRFPYLCFRWGGAIFLLPYLLCFFFLGLPMLMLEFAIGQITQKSAVNVWAQLNPRLAGIGIGTVYASYAVGFYYTVIIAWSVVYFFCGFISPLPWSTQRAAEGTDGRFKDCAAQEIPITQEFFYKDILHIINEDCSSFSAEESMSDSPTYFQWQCFLGMIVVWIAIFFCVCKGVKLSSKVVWVTVPGPVIFVIIMVLNSLTLPGSDYGYRMYLKGEEKGVAPNWGEKLSSGSMWSEACGQIFFSIGVCLGVMISYASYNPENQPVISNSIYVAGGNSCFSFIAGFAVFGVVGYLNEIESPVSDKLSSNGLAFVAYPAAIDTMPGANFWTLVLASCLFLLGVDSAFSFIEGASTVVCDTKWARDKKYSKFCIAATLCAIGATGSTLFCFNWGFVFFDVVDYYLMTYLVLLLAILQAVAVAWYFGFEDALALAEGKGRLPTLVLVFGYWVFMPILGVLAYAAFPNSSWVSIPLFWVYLLVLLAVSAFLAKSNGIALGDWYKHVVFSGARPVARKMIALHEVEMGGFAAAFFEFWWCACIKFVFPWAIWWLFAMTTADNVRKPYGGYHIGWQVIGALIPIAGLVLFALPFFFGNTWFADQNDDAFRKAFAYAAESPVQAKTATTAVAAAPESATKKAEE